MAELWKCDRRGCGVTVDIAGAVDWLRVDVVGFRTEVYGGPPGAGDFCSVACLLLYYRVASRQTEEAVTS